MLDRRVVVGCGPKNPVMAGCGPTNPTMARLEFFLEKACQMVHYNGLYFDISNVLLATIFLKIFILPLINGIIVTPIC